MSVWAIAQNDKGCCMKQRVYSAYDGGPANVLGQLYEASQVQHAKKYEKCNYVVAVLLEEFKLYNHVPFGKIHLACNL